MFFSRDESHVFDFGSETFVGMRHDEFVLEIRQHPQAADDHPGVDFAAEIDRQPAVRGNAYVRFTGKGLSHHLQSLLRTEYDVFQRPVENGDDEFIEFVKLRWKGADGRYLERFRRIVLFR